MNDILMKVTVYNRGPEAATIHVLPHLWFRNFWKHNPRFNRPEITSQLLPIACKPVRTAMEIFFSITRVVNNCSATMKRITSGCTIRRMILAYVKDGINNYIIHKENTVNPKKKGTKAAIWLKEKIQAGSLESL